VVTTRLYVRTIRSSVLLGGFSSISNSGSGSRISSSSSSSSSSSCSITNRSSLVVCSLFVISSITGSSINSSQTELSPSDSSSFSLEGFCLVCSHHPSQTTHEQKCCINQYHISTSVCDCLCCETNRRLVLYATVLSGALSSNFIIKNSRSTVCN